MKKLEAAMRDHSAKAWRERKVMYKVGSVFKGCHHCGDYEVEVSDSGAERKRYSSGFNIFRSYDPRFAGWTYWCYECGAKDLQAWEDAHDLGQPPVQGTAEAKKKAKYRLLKERMKLQPRAVVLTRQSEIAMLEAQIARLEAKIKGGM